MFRDILILLDNQEICPEALDYAREFALRMDARVTFLMLVRMTFLGRAFLNAKRADLSRVEDSAARLLSHASELFIQAGIEVGSACKVGEPAQELLKFLAIPIRCPR